MVLPEYVAPLTVAPLVVTPTCQFNEIEPLPKEHESAVGTAIERAVCESDEF